MEEEEEEEKEEGEGRMDGWIKQNPPNTRVLPVSGFLHVNVNQHELSLSGKQGRREMDGGMDGWEAGMARRNTLRTLLPGCAVCV